MTPPPRIHALIVAAGTGTRAGEGAPKQFRPIAGRAMLCYSVEAMLAHPAITAVQTVIGAGQVAEYDAAVRGCKTQEEKRAQAKLLPPVTGGAARSDSVRAGIMALAACPPDYVLIHDAARPFLARAVLDALIAKLSPAHAVAPALPVVDTVRRHAEGAWSDVPRDGLMRIQTPQCFPYAKIRELTCQFPNHENSAGTSTQNPSTHGAALAATDDIALWLAADLPVVYTQGDEDLRKVTTAADMIGAEKHAHALGSHGKGASAHRIAIGMGYDVHQLVPAGEQATIRLGGIDIAHTHKLHGHSDADVVLHAIVDALLGALAEGDIGALFPPGDAQWKGADSQLFVAEAQRRMRARGGAIQHLDVTIICEAPKIGPHRDAIRATIAAMLHLPLAYVSIKATTTEQLGFTGRGEGIAAQAVATITLPAEIA